MGFYAATRQPGGLCDLGLPPQAVWDGEDRAWPLCSRVGPAVWRAERRGAHQKGGLRNKSFLRQLGPVPATAARNTHTHTHTYTYTPLFDSTRMVSKPARFSAWRKAVVGHVVSRRRALACGIKGIPTLKPRAARGRLCLPPWQGLAEVRAGIPAAAPAAQGSPRAPTPTFPVSDCTVPCHVMVHPEYAYSSALLWADLP